MKSASPTFEFKIMIELAENLALQELNKSSMSAQAQSTSSANIDYLIKLCPIMTSLNNGKMKSPSPSTNSEADSNNNKDLDSDDIMTDYASESKQQQQPVLLVRVFPSHQQIFFCFVHLIHLWWFFFAVLEK